MPNSKVEYFRINDECQRIFKKANKLVFTECLLQVRSIVGKQVKWGVVNCMYIIKRCVYLCFEMK